MQDEFFKSLDSRMQDEFLNRYSHLAEIKFVNAEKRKRTRQRCLSCFAALPGSVGSLSGLDRLIQVYCQRCRELDRIR